MKITFTTDPNNKFPEVAADRLMEACGLIPPWLITGEYLDKDIRTALDAQYCFGLHEMTGHTITQDGTFQYPEDPDLYPILKVERGEEVFYQYQYGIVCIIKDGITFVTRMD